jgi:hypothetical protein
LKSAVATGVLASGFPATAAQNPIKVGAVLPFSGGLELFGNQAKLGLDLAMKEINDGGGILGRPLEILYSDNKTDPKTSVERTTKLIQRDEVVAVTGPITSNGRDAMAPTVKRLKTPLLYATNYEGGACDRYIFCFNTVPNQELAKLLPHMNATAGTSYYMFGADYVWPQKMFETAQGIIKGLRQRRQGAGLRPAGRRRHHLHQAGRGLRSDQRRDRRVPGLLRGLSGRLRRRQGPEHVGHGAPGLLESGRGGQGLRGPAPQKRRRGRRHLALCHDSLQCYQCFEGGT